MRRFLLTSDFHPDATTAGFPRFADVKSAVEETVQVAIEQRVDGYFFLGDLADPDSPCAHAAAGLATWAAASLAEAGISSRWLVGNHDALEDGSGSSTLDALAGMARGFAVALGVRVFSKPAAEYFLPGIRLVALPYTARSHSYDPAAFVRSVVRGEDRVLVLGHLNLEGITPGSESIDMPRGRDVVFPIEACLERWGDRALLFNGHYHQRQVHRGVQVVGSLERLTFGEADSTPGYLIVEVED